MRKLALASLILGFACSSSQLFGGTIPVIIGNVSEGSSSVSGTAVELFLDDGNSVFDSGDVVVATVSTDADGRFEFSSLDASSNYFVRYNNMTSELVAPGSIGFLIDSFEASQSVVATPISGVQTATMEGSVLGNFRDMMLLIETGTSDGKLRVNPFSLEEHLQIDMSAGVTGIGSVIWDGVAGTSGQPEHGLDVDFTADGTYEAVALELAVDRAGAGQMLELIVYSGEGNSSTALVEFPVVDDVELETLQIVPFSDFVGTADFSSVSAFQLMIDADVPSLDARIGLLGLIGPNQVNFQIVPEPSSILLMLGSFVCLLGYRGRRTKVTR